jgi:ubiquinone/menaquinone biosynthesis C-methylase UbiE
MGNQSLLSIIRCPKCHEKLEFLDKNVKCNSCKEVYSKDKNNALTFMTKSMYSSEDEFNYIKSVSNFWGSGWNKRAQHDHKSFFSLDRQGLYLFADKIMSRIGPKSPESGSGGLWSKEVDFSNMSGNIGLNIGSGAGMEALYLMTQGRCSMVTLDITKESRDLTQKIMDKVGNGLALHGDARYLPINSSSIDFVYSSGVLHHSENISQSILEVHRVLKPGGVAYIGLYSKSSIFFQWRKLKSIIRGTDLGAETEGDWRVDGSKCPHTEIFNKKDCKNLFFEFKKIHIRRGAFSVPNWKFAKLFKFLEHKKYLSVIGKGIYIKAIK